MCIVSIALFGLRRLVVARVTLRIEVRGMPAKRDDERVEELKLILGAVVARTGPLTLSYEDLALYQFSQLIPCMERAENNAGVKVFLLGEDEYGDANFSGRG